MAVKPTDTIDWVATGETVSPTAGKKAAGFASGERPPSQFFNWFWVLVTSWIAWLNDFESDPHTWIATQTHQNDLAANNTPSVEYADTDGRVRRFVDTLGARGGSMIERSYWWINTADVGSSQNDAIIVAGPGSSGEIEGDTGGNSSINFLAPDEADSSWPTNCLQLICGTSADDHSQIHSNLSLSALNGWILGDDASFALEWSAARRTTGTPDHDWYMGLHDVEPSGSADVGDGTVASFIHIRLEDGDTNWQCAAANGTAETVVDSGVAPVADTMQMFRIEYHGANSPAGVANSTSAVVRFYIDGAEVAEITSTNVPAGTSEGHLGLLFRIDRPGGVGTGSGQLELGLMHWSFSPLFDILGSGAGYTLS